VATKKKIESANEDALPAAMLPVELTDVLRRLVKSRYFVDSMAVAELLGKEKLRPMAQEFLVDLGSHVSYGMSFSAEEAGKPLAWGQKLIEWGADPFLHQGSEADYTYKKSFFEMVVKGGYWAYAGLLVASDPDGVEKSKAAFDRMNVSESPRRYSSVVAGQACAPTRAQEILAQSGAKALALGFKSGMDPNTVVLGQPWMFSSIDAPSLQAFIDAGANPTARNGQGHTLSEAIASREPSRARQELLSLARKVQSGENAGDKPAATREALALAKAGSAHREVHKAARAAGMELRDIKSENGMPMLGVAIESGNWGLVGEMLKTGADPKQLTPSGFPVAAMVLSSTASASRSSTSSAKLVKARDCMDALIDSLDFSWRSEQGEPLLEAFCKSKHSQGPLHIPYEALSRWIKKEPLDATNPLWHRLHLLGESPWVVRSCAEQRPDEPWHMGKLMLMELLLMGSLPKISSYGERSWDTENGLGKFFQRCSSGEGARARMERICAPEQWEAAFSAYWKAARENKSDYQCEELATRVVTALEYWVGLAAKLDLEPFDMQRLSQSVTQGWQPGADGSSPRVNAGEAIHIFGNKICALMPYKAGGLLLDILDVQRSSAIEVGYRIWRFCQKEKVKLALPESHPLFSEPGRVGAELANHIVWRQIEEHLVEKASVSSKKVRL
jgi:hypothetical protein